MLDNYDVLLIKASVISWPFTSNLLYQLQVIETPKAACVQCHMDDDGKWVQCDQCKDWFHYAYCVNLEEDASIMEIEWLCGSCC